MVMQRNPWTRRIWDTQDIPNTPSYVQNKLYSNEQKPAVTAQNQTVTNAPAIASNYGVQYNNPGGGWNPWSLYDGREGFDGSAVDGYYNAAADRNAWENNGTPENDRNRVWRWTLDQARAEGWDAGSPANAQRLQAAFLNNVARLRRDYNAPENVARGLNWQNSAFSGYDRFAQGGRPQIPNNNPMAQNPPASNPASSAAPGAGGGANPASSTSTAPSTVPTAAGGLSPAQRLALASDPDQAYRYMMQQLGMNPDAPGLLGKFLQQRFKPLLEARMAAAGLDAGGESSYVDTIDQIINQFGGGFTRPGGNPGAGGAGFFGDLSNIANQAQGAGAGYLNKLQDQSQAIQYLNQLGTLRFAGANPLIQQAASDEMGRARNAFQDLSFQNELQGHNISPFEEWLRQSQYRSIYGY